MKEKTPPEPSPVINRILHEPLFQFLVLAGLLFVAQALFSGDQREVIAVDAATQEFLIQQREELVLKPLTDAEKQQTIENYIEQEILVREARKRGFTENSSIRDLLLRNMRFFISGDLGEPGDDDLKAFYEANRGDFTTPLTFDLEHIYYADPSDVPDGLVDLLNAGADPEKFGDQDPAIGRRLRFIEEGRLISGFGRETARTLLDLPDNDTAWHGPFLSEGGNAHFLRVLRRNTPELIALDEARDWVSAQWMAAESQRLMEEALETMRPDYRIEIETPVASGE